MSRRMIVRATRCIWITLFPALLVVDFLFARNGYDISGPGFTLFMIGLHTVVAYSWYEAVFVRKEPDVRLLIGGVVLLVTNFVVMAAGAFSLIDERQFLLALAAACGVIFLVRQRLTPRNKPR